MNIPTEIRDRIIEAIADLKVRLQVDPSDVTIASAVRQEALPLMPDLGGTICLRPSGELIRLGWDDEGPVSAVDPVNEIPVLLEALAAYPWLSGPIPAHD